MKKHNLWLLTSFRIYYAQYDNGGNFKQSNFMNFSSKMVCKNITVTFPIPKHWQWITQGTTCMKVITTCIVPCCQTFEADPHQLNSRYIVKNITELH